MRRAAELGATWIGFVFVEASPRHVTPEDAKRLLAFKGAARTVALLVDPSDADVDAAAVSGVDALQLHGAESADRAAQIKDRSGLEVWKAIGVSSVEDLQPLRTFNAVDRLLIDAKPPRGARRTGGHGQAFDWSILDGWDAPLPWILAGGLTVENVARAIDRTGAAAVDVSSGVEGEKGLKSDAMMGAFINAARGPRLN